MTSTRALILALLLAGAAPLAPSSLSAQTTTATLPDSAPPILTMTGKTREGRTIDLTMTDLRKLPRLQIRTTTPWHDGEQVFEGVPLGALLEHVGAKGEVLRVTALNKYRTDIPASDTKHGPVLAYLRNGEPMPVRDKGPLFIIYPYDRDPALKSELYFSRSAWQVRSIAID